MIQTNIIYNEDCRLTLDRLPDNSVDLFLQDTPFGCTQNKWDIKPDLKEMWKHWLRVGKPTAPYIFFATQPFASELIMSNLKMFRYDLIWYKVGKSTGFLNASIMPLRNHELILVFYKKSPTYNPQKYIGSPNHSRGGRHHRGDKQTNNNYGKFNNMPPSEPTNDKFPISILEFNSVHPPIHPTQKPLDLIRYLIRTYSNPDDITFDGYAGSGTMAEAAIIEGRQFICAEMDKENGYYEHAVKRVQNRLSKPELFAA